MSTENNTLHRTVQGKTIDMNKLMMKNENTIAIGNMDVNARGDSLGPGGKVVKKSEEYRVPSSNTPDQIDAKTASNTATVTSEPGMPQNAVPAEYSDVVAEDVDSAPSTAQRKNKKTAIKYIGEAND